MSRRRGPALALAAAAALAPALTADEGAQPRLKVTLRPAQAEIGDPVRADLELLVPAGLAVGPPLFPSWEEGWGETEVAAAGDPVSEPVPGGAIRYRQTLTLIPWNTGEIVLPAPLVEVPTAAEILRVAGPEATVLTVASVLPQGEEEPAPKPPAPPRPLPVGKAFWWTLAAAAAACLLAAGVLVLQRRAALAAARPAAVDPLVALRRELARLEAKDEPLVLIAGLSLALRRYLGRRLGFPAAESTTTEIRRRLQQLGLPPAVIGGVDRLLRRCDAIKFARRPIERDACAAPLAEAASLAEAVEAHLRPAAEDEAGAGREAA